MANSLPPTVHQVASPAALEPHLLTPASLPCGFRTEYQFRVIINDGMIPLTSANGCPADKDKMYPVKRFVATKKETIMSASWEWAFHGDWKLEEGWETIRGVAGAQGMFDRLGALGLDTR
ncbi:hypothetical protein BDV93DRAFT_309882 [Ceratobasidium sp. AG-I]|nr:hypothetical protein BDV93DRAFT_309882 [Ceratobasidium sp. AG-I]